MNWEMFSIKLISGNIDVSLEPSISIILLWYQGLLEVKWDYILSITNLSKRKGTQYENSFKESVFSKGRCMKWKSTEMSELCMIRIF